MAMEFVSLYKTIVNNVYMLLLHKVTVLLLTSSFLSAV